MRWIALHLRPTHCQGRLTNGKWNHNNFYPHYPEMRWFGWLTIRQYYFPDFPERGPINHDND